MTWDEFYERVFDWADSTVKSKISALEDIGPGEDVTDVILNLSDEKLRTQLLRKAIRLGVDFSWDDFCNLEGEVSDAAYAELAAYIDADPDDVWFDEETMTWDDFYNAYCDWSETLLARRIPLLHSFGPAEEVYEAVELMPTIELSDALFERAQACGVHFTNDQLVGLGYPVFDGDPGNEPEPPPAKVPKLGFFAMLGALFGSKPKRDTGRCDGDCAHCPAHYGYRYGRWYYGHGHQHGCQRGGNGGASGKCSRD